MFARWLIAEALKYAAVERKQRHCRVREHAVTQEI
jgi:hypothetical protein